MSNTIQSKPLADTPLNSTDILPIVQDGVLKRTTVSVIAATNEETGTWTPTYTADGTDFDAVTYGSARVGKYVKVGKLVYVELRLLTDSITKGSASGNVRISGLPFPVETNAGGQSSAAGTISSATEFLADHPCEATFVQGTSQIALQKRPTSVSATTFLVVADIDTGTSDNNILASGWYITS